MSVRKREWTTSQGEARTAWVVDYKTRDKKRCQETFATQKEAKARAAEVAVDIRDGVHVARGASITVAQAGENWIARADADNLDRFTIRQYRQHLDGHIKPFIGSVKLADLTGPQVNSFERALHNAKASVAMRRKVLSSLSSLLRLAMREGYVNRNVADGHRVKTNKRAKRKLKIGVDIPSLEEIRALIGVVEGRFRPFFLTAIFTGMRASELRGLRWENVDLKKREIHVRERTNADNQFGHPKSESSERTIPIGPFVANTLKEWKLECPNGDLGLAFPTGVGSVGSHSNIRTRELIPLMEKAGIVDKKGKAKYTGTHALRHFYASWLINPKELGGQGVPPKVVQERLGHSTLAMTMDTYGHLFPRGDDTEQLREAELALIG